MLNSTVAMCKNTFVQINDMSIRRSLFQKPTWMPRVTIADAANQTDEITFGPFL
jgi:hypothetical protein